MFAAEFDVLLYDLTSSHVEGAAPKAPMLQRGYSRDHRGDCKQVVLALIVNVDGFPLSDEPSDGDRTDETTLETVMRLVERKYGQARRVWGFDRGMVSEANLAALRRRGGQYLVGTPRTKLRTVERALLERRVKAHILMAFLGYALWVTLKHRLRQRATGLTPAGALAHLVTVQTADIILPTTDGREIRLCRVATPD